MISNSQYVDKGNDQNVKKSPDRTSKSGIQDETPKFNKEFNSKTLHPFSNANQFRTQMRKSGQIIEKEIMISCHVINSGSKNSNSDKEIKMPLYSEKQKSINAECDDSIIENSEFVEKNESIVISEKNDLPISEDNINPIKQRSITKNSTQKDDFKLPKIKEEVDYVKVRTLRKNFFKEESAIKLDNSATFENKDHSTKKANNIVNSARDRLKKIDGKIHFQSEIMPNKRKEPDASINQHNVDLVYSSSEIYSKVIDPNKNASSIRLSRNSKENILSSDKSSVSFIKKEQTPSILQEDVDSINDVGDEKNNISNMQQNYKYSSIKTNNKNFRVMYTK